MFLPKAQPTDKAKERLKKKNASHEMSKKSESFKSIGKKTKFLDLGFFRI